MDDAAKLQNENEHKQQKMVIHTLIKKSKMPHYHEARANPKDYCSLFIK